MNTIEQRDNVPSQQKIHPETTGIVALTTDELVLQLEKLPIHNVGIRLYNNVDFSSERFIELLGRKDSSFSIRSTRGGERISTKQDAGYLAFHTDGVTPGPVPELVILYCVDPGSDDAPTFFTNTTEVLSLMKPAIVNQLQQLNFVIVNEAGERSQTAYPFIRQHSRTGESVVQTIIPSLPEPKPGISNWDLESVVLPVNQFLQVAKESRVKHTWQRSQLLIWDNQQYIHGREEGQKNSSEDGRRTLLRVHLDTK